MNMDRLREYVQHKRDCKVLVQNASYSMAPWPVSQALRDKYPDIYGMCVCTCGLDSALRAALAEPPVYKNPYCTIDHPGSSCNIACGYE